jgi:hypothetical protein
MACLVSSVFCEALGEAMAEFFPILVPTVVALLKEPHGTDHSSVDVKRSAAYCIGVFSLYCPRGFQIFSSGEFSYHARGV